MSSLQYELEYAEEERADYTREQDDYYSVGNYDFDTSYEFDNGPREDDQCEEQQDSHMINIMKRRVITMISHLNQRTMIISSKKNMIISNMKKNMIIANRRKIIIKRWNSKNNRNQ